MTAASAWPPFGDRDFTVIRNPDTSQWALHAFPEPHMPYAETIYFTPFPAELERVLLRLSPKNLLDYFMKFLGELPIADIDVRGDAEGLGRVLPWSYRLSPVVRGEIRFGGKCGPNVAREGGVRYAS